MVVEPDETIQLTDYAPDGVDLTMIRWFLSLTPAERLDVHQRQIDDIVEIRKLNGVKSDNLEKVDFGSAAEANSEEITYATADVDLPRSPLS